MPTHLLHANMHTIQYHKRMWCSAAHLVTVLHWKHGSPVHIVQPPGPCQDATWCDACRWVDDTVLVHWLKPMAEHWLDKEINLNAKRNQSPLPFARQQELCDGLLFLFYVHKPSIVSSDSRTQNPQDLQPTASIHQQGPPKPCNDPWWHTVTSMWARSWTKSVSWCLQN